MARTNKSRRAQRKDKVRAKAAAREEGRKALVRRPLIAWMALGALLVLATVRFQQWTLIDTKTSLAIGMGAGVVGGLCLHKLFSWCFDTSSVGWSLIYGCLALGPQVTFAVLGSNLLWAAPDSKIVEANLKFISDGRGRPYTEAGQPVIVRVDLDGHERELWLPDRSTIAGQIVHVPVREGRWGWPVLPVESRGAPAADEEAAAD